MIMAGRGQHLAKIDDEKNKVGIPQTLSEHSPPLSWASILKKINEINTSNINQSLLVDIHNELKELFTSKQVLREVLSDLHNKALSDSEFGEKLVLALEDFSNFEVDGVVLRGELLSFIQNDFKVKETMAQSDPKTFLNSVLLLGNIYHKFKVCGAPIAILGVALLEYFDLLIKGNEEELKALAKQIFINGKNLSSINKYELLMENIRNILISKNLSSSSKCWLLLAIDFMSNDFKPFKKVIEDFYVNQLGEDYIKLKELNQQEVNPSDNLSFDSLKTEDSTSSEKTNTNSVLNQSEGSNKDLSKKLSEVKIKSDIGVRNKVQSPPGKNFKRDPWKPKGTGKGSSGHDDRFERDENFYGVQKPRQVKPENQRKKFHDFKNNYKGFNNFKIEIDNKTDPQPKTASDNS